MNKLLILAFVAGALLFQGCRAIEEALQPSVTYPCSIGCGNDNITPPKGYVYYQNRIMSLDEFNRITHQHIIQE